MRIINFLGKELKFHITFLSSLLKTDLPKKGERKSNRNAISKKKSEKIYE